MKNLKVLTWQEWCHLRPPPRQPFPRHWVLYHRFCSSCCLKISLISSHHSKFRYKYDMCYRLRKYAMFVYTDVWYFLQPAWIDTSGHWGISGMSSCIWGVSSAAATPEKALETAETVLGASVLSFWHKIILSNVVTDGVESGLKYSYIILFCILFNVLNKLSTLRIFSMTKVGHVFEKFNLWNFMTLFQWNGF